MRPDIDPKVDYPFKKLFGSEQNTPLLIHLLNAVLQPPPAALIASLEIRNPFNDKTTLDDKLSIVDIKARDQNGRLFDVEMQLLASRVLTDRILYYWARLHGEQLREGEDYLRLRPTYAVCFLNDMLYPEIPEHHLQFRLWEQQHGLAFSNHLVMHLLELPKFNLRADQLQTPLDAWCYFLRHGAQLDSAALPSLLDAPPFKQAMEVLCMMTQDQLERERYEARLRLQRDHSSSLRDAHAKGLEEGIEKGLEKGRQEGLEKGRLIGQIQFCQQVLKRPLTAREELLAQSLEQLEQLAKQLAEQLLQAAP